VKKIERELGRLAERYGFGAPARTSKGHFAFKHPSGRTVYFSGTPGDRWALERLKQKFRIMNKENA
jgi:hypothetical protein